MARLLEETNSANGGLSLQLCAALAESLPGLQTQLAEDREDLIERSTHLPFVLSGDELAVLYAVRPGEVLFGVPSRRTGQPHRITDALAAGGGQRPTGAAATHPAHHPKSRFGLKWFLPAIRKNRRALIEVLVHPCSCSCSN